VGHGYSLSAKGRKTNKSPQDSRESTGLWKLCLNDFAATQTGSADAHVLVGGAHLGVNRAQIDVPAPLTHIVGVADGISELRPLAADITNSCHNSEVLPGLMPKQLAKLQFYRKLADFAKEWRGLVSAVPPGLSRFFDL